MKMQIYMYFAALLYLQDSIYLKEIYRYVTHQTTYLRMLEVIFGTSTTRAKVSNHFQRETTQGSPFIILHMLFIAFVTHDLQIV